MKHFIIACLLAGALLEPAPESVAADMAKRADDITFKLVDIVSKGGNYLLNVGPMGDGFIPQPSQDILRRVGQWLKVNGEAIYGAGRTPFGAELAKSDMRSTVRPMDWAWGKPAKIYVHFFKWPGARFELGDFSGQVEKAYMLADPDRKPLRNAVREGKVAVDLPEKANDAIDSVLCLEVNN